MEEYGRSRKKRMKTRKTIKDLRKNGSFTKLKQFKERKKK